MNLFEFLLVFVSILLGLGITELLSGVVRILRGELPAGKLHTLWILIVFLVQAQLAWGLWLLRSMVEWRYPEFLLLLSGPLVLYMAAAVLFPAAASGGNLDTHLMQRRRAFFSLMLAYVGFTALFEYFLLDNGLELVSTAFRLVAASLLMALVISERWRLHWALALAVLERRTFSRLSRPACIETKIQDSGFVNAMPDSAHACTRATCQAPTAT